MASGNIFAIMMNDGKQDIMLNATQKLRERMTEIQNQQRKAAFDEAAARFSKPPAADDRTYAADRAAWLQNPTLWVQQRARSAHATLHEIAKTHSVYVSQSYRPFVAMAYSYMKVVEKEGMPRFGSDVSFIIPRVGTWIGDMVLHVRLTGLRCTDARDKAKYCAMLGHRLIERARFMVNGIALSEYDSEHMNRHFQFSVPTHKRTAWLRNIGQEVPHLAFTTPDPTTDEFREYRWFGDGPQTLKREHQEVDLYIPLLFWFNLDVAQAFPNCMVPKGQVRVQISLPRIEKLVAAVNYGGGGAYIPPQISTFDLYVNQITTLPEVEEIMLRDYVFQLIRVPKRLTHTLIDNEGSILLKDMKFPVENMAVSFRPAENLNNVDHWHRSARLTPVDIMEPVVISGSSPAVGINYARYYTETPVVDRVGITVSGGIELHAVDTVKKYSSFHPYAAVGVMAPEDQGWLYFTQQFGSGYNPSGHIDLSRNREIYLEYSATGISDQSPVQLDVDAQCINFLTVKRGDVNLKYYK